MWRAAYRQGRGRAEQLLHIVISCRARRRRASIGYLLRSLPHTALSPGWLILIFVIGRLWAILTIGKPRFHMRRTKLARCVIDAQLAVEDAYGVEVQTKEAAAQAFAGTET